MKRIALVLAACAVCIEWTRLSGTVKGIDLLQSTVTIQDRSGDLLTIPIDYQVAIVERHGELRALRTLHLEDRITLTRIPAAPPPKDEEEGLAPPEPSQRGH